MAEPFKTFFNPVLIEGTARHLARVSPEFDREAFLGRALAGLDDLEMMERAGQIGRAIDAAFPDDIALKTDAMVRALHPRTDMALSEMAVDDQGLAGWAVAPMAQVVARGGLGRPRESLLALREMTMRFSAEFSVRPFFRDHRDLTLETAMGWSGDANVHVRRLASEGSRPRLPWGIRLDAFVRDPAPLIPILMRLRDDPEEYVRRSVANNLNDIAKDHPDLVGELAADWLKEAGAERKRLVRHACRTLIKQGHAGALAAFGYPVPKLRDVRLSVTGAVRLGGTLEIVLEAVSEADQRLHVDYVLHFLRANGKRSPKVFKWTEVRAKKGERVRLAKAHPYRKVTTRKDYPGRQSLSVQVNGQMVAEAGFDLSV